MATSFLGTGWGFPPEFGKNRKIRLSSEEEDIRESLEIILSTNPGERVMRPTFGCGLNKVVFEHINQSTVTEIIDIVERAILFFEPRITLDKVELDFQNPVEGRLLMNLKYTVRSTNNRSNMVYPFYYLEGTNL